MVGPEADALPKGYGRRKGRLELEEAAGLLETGKIEIKDEEGEALNPDEFLKRALEISPEFGMRYIVYRDLKERGYVVQPGGADFWLYPRGAKPGEKPARYFIRISSESDSISLKELEALLILARNMRKEPILAVVDDESDITYYDMNEATFEKQEEKEEEEEEIGKVKATLFGNRVAVWAADSAATLHRTYFYGNLTKDKRLLLSFVEAAYLMKEGLLEIDAAPPKLKTFERFIEYASTIEDDFGDKYMVYEDLMGKGLMVKTGFKFGSHFRVYKAMQQKHSSYLIHVLHNEHVFSMPELSRAVRLAHGVKKRMIFVQLFRERLVKNDTHDKIDQKIRYIDIGRMKL